MRSGTVLIIDDDEPLRSALAKLLARAGHSIQQAGNCRSGLASVRGDPPDVIICDYELPDGTALDFIADLKNIDAGARVIVLTGHGTIDLAVRAIKQGAEHFLTKPPDFATLLELVTRSVGQRRMERRFLALDGAGPSQEVDPFLGSSPAIRELRETAIKIAASDTTVLIHGETGSGKGVLAKWLHGQSRRRDEPLVDLNCAGLAGDLLDSEVFGHEKGAFTGAVARKVGLLEVAHRGTLFLDEVGDMDLRVQGKLLKVLEEQSFRRVGDVTSRVVDVRLIAATHHNLKQLVAAKRFREDLYFRISTVPLNVPPLRERTGDIALLSEHFLTRLGLELARPPFHLSQQALRALQAYHWPGNIRELRNVLERAALLSDHAELSARDFHFDVGVIPERAADRATWTLQDVERDHIERVLQAVNGRVTAAAERLGVPRSTLYQKIRELGIPTSRN